MSERSTGNGLLEQLTLFAEDFRAKTCPLRDAALEWQMEPGPASFTRLSASWKNAGPNGSSSKTSRAYSRAAAGRISDASSPRWMTSGMAWRGEFWTADGSECPNGGVESSLSGILEPYSPRLSRYILSAKAAKGILRRARKRGKQLPRRLEEALEALASTAR